MKVVVKKLDELHKAERNVRRHNDKQIKEYVRSLRMFGQIRPIVIDETNTIIAGNGLYEALVSMGSVECDCFVVNGLSDKEKKKLMLADNRVYELGMTDMDAFDSIIRELGEDIDVPGWDAELIEAINFTPEEADAQIETYGVFEPAEINTINRRQREEHATATVKPSPYPSPEPPIMEPQQASASESRYVVCPKCGEHIAY